MNAEVARTLGVSESVQIVAGMTDGCTAQIAAGAVHDGDTMGVLGTTLVLKAVSETPVESADGAVYSHLAPDGHYWAGGASNPGAGILAVEFAGEDLGALDRRVADTVAGYVRYPLSVAGERFPVAERNLLPLTDGEPRSRLDAYRALLEGVAFVERLGLERLQQLGVTPRRHVIAGGATASAAGLEPDPGYRPRAGRPGQRRPVRQQQRRSRDPGGLRAHRRTSDRDRRPPRTHT